MKILTVCGMGFGTSMLLKMTLEKVLKEKGITADVETADFSTASSAHADFIFTNEEFAKQLEGGKAKVVGIKNIMDANEVKVALESVIKT